MRKRSFPGFSVSLEMDVSSETRAEHAPEHARNTEAAVEQSLPVSNGPSIEHSRMPTEQSPPACFSGTQTSASPSQCIPVD